MASGRLLAGEGPAVYGTIVVVGGGCYGSWYVRQLARAHRARALTWHRVLVIDRDAACAAAQLPELNAAPDLPRIELVVSEWRAFFHDYLSRCESTGSAPPAGEAGDAIVPSPLMPHLMYEWIFERAAHRWPGRVVATRPLAAPPPTPWERASPDGTHYASFAVWVCPVNCIEPERCPHTRGPRSWTMPAALKEYVESRRAAGEILLGPLVFHCTHRAYGVGMIDVSAVIEADRTIAHAARESSASFLVGTVSHCHGALNILSVE